MTVGSKKRGFGVTVGEVLGEANNLWAAISTNSGTFLDAAASIISGKL